MCVVLCGSPALPVLPKKDRQCSPARRFFYFYKKIQMKRFEHKNEALASPKRFQRRLLRHVFYGLALVAFSLALGTAGYCFYGKMPLVDGFYNASMILTGMGPINEMKTKLLPFFEEI